VVPEVTLTRAGARLFPELETYIAHRLGDSDVDRGHEKLLERIADHVAAKVGGGQPARLVFICTHNSRRSQFCQFWALAAAHHFSIPGVETFSGGTVSTAFSPRAVAALRRAGFAVELFSDGKNPVYEVRYEPLMEPIQAFSKVYDAPPNPTEGFVAIMTCSSADAACPAVVGAVERIAIPYHDPKQADGTEHEAEIYDQRCAEIAREMLYLFANVAGRMEFPSLRDR
jgi:protein-tyrosine-phosphatase